MFVILTFGSHQHVCANCGGTFFLVFRTVLSDLTPFWDFLVQHRTGYKWGEGRGVSNDQELRKNVKRKKEYDWGRRTITCCEWFFSKLIPISKVLVEGGPGGVFFWWAMSNGNLYRKDWDYQTQVWQKLSKNAKSICSLDTKSWKERFERLEATKWTKKLRKRLKLHSFASYKHVKKLNWNSRLLWCRNLLAQCEIFGFFKWFFMYPTWNPRDNVKSNRQTKSAP